MRVFATQNAPFTAAPSGVRRASAGSFSLSAANQASAGQATAPMRALGGIDALLALQAFDDTGTRRKRAIAAGRDALDALEDLKLALLAGRVDPHAMGRLRTALSGTRERSGEEQLDQVLEDIELRLEVEVAKLQRA